MLLSRLLAAVMALFAVAVVSAVVLASTAEGTQSSDANNVALSEAVTSSSWSQQPATTQVSTPSSSSAPTDQAATAASSPSTVPTTDTTNVSTTTVALLAGASPSTTQAPTTTSASTTTQGPTTTAAPTTTQAPTTTVAPTTTQAPATTTTAPGGSFNPSYESQFRSLINGLRSTPLLSDSSLNSYARNWAKHMADTDSFSHSNIGSLLDPWSTVGENIAWGYSVSSMFDGLNASPGHHANMVNTSFTHVGVGVWVDADGRIWTTHVFGG